MKFIRSIGRLAGAVVVSCAAVATASAQDLLGTWDCGAAIDDPTGQGNISIQFEATFSDNGVYERSGEMSIAIEALQLDATLSIMETGTWTRDGMALKTTTTELAIEPAGDEAPSPMVQMFAQQMQASSQNAGEQTLAITSLTATTMTIDSSGSETSCERT